MSAALSFHEFLREHAAPADAAFRAWFGNSKVVENGKPLVVYHGTRAEFDDFHSSYGGQTDDGYYGRGFYFTPDKDYAREYGANVLSLYLSIQNPFTIPVAGAGSHPSLLDLRDKLADLKGMPPELRTKRTLPPGYEVRSEEQDHPYVHGKKYTTYSVYPKRELWDDPNARYGRDKETELDAIVHFNEEEEEHGDWYHAGWASSLLNNRLKFYDLTQILKDNGYDGVLVVHAEDNSLSEIVAFEPTQIKAVDNDGTWDASDPNMRS